MIHYSIVDHVDAWDMCDGILVTTDVLILPRAYVDGGEIVDGVGPSRFWWRGPRLRVVRFAFPAEMS